MQRDLPGVLPIASRRPRDVAGRIQVESPRGFRKVGAQHGGAVGADDGAEPRQERRDAIVTGRSQLDDVHRDRISRLGAFYMKGTCLRVVVPGQHHFRWKV